MAEACRLPGHACQYPTLQGCTSSIRIFSSRFLIIPYHFPTDIVIGFPFLMINLVTGESLMCINATVKIVLENNTFVFYFLFSNLIKFSFKILMSLASIQNDSWKLYFHFLFSNVIKFSFNDVILINLNINQQKVENFFVYDDVVLIIQFFKFVFQRLISPLLNFERTFKTFVIWRWFKVCR